MVGRIHTYWIRSLRKSPGICVFPMLSWKPLPKRCHSFLDTNLIDASQVDIWQLLCIEVGRYYDLSFLAEITEALGDHVTFSRGEGNQDSAPWPPRAPPLLSVALLISLHRGSCVPTMSVLCHILDHNPGAHWTTHDTPPHICLKLPSICPGPIALPTPCLHASCTDLSWSCQGVICLHVCHPLC